MTKKNWTGDNKSAFRILGASNHVAEERELKQCSNCSNTQKYLCKKLCRKCYHRKKRYGNPNGKPKENIKDDRSKHPEYRNYRAMIERCYQKSCNNYDRYGGRGIRVCERWLNPIDGFWNFVSDMGERPKNKTLDRIDNNGDYSPENCKWSNAREQALNRRTNIFLSDKNGNTKSISEWSKILGVSRATLEVRYHKGWSDIEILYRKKTKNQFSKIEYYNDLKEWKETQRLNG